MYALYIARVILEKICGSCLMTFTRGKFRSSLGASTLQKRANLVWLLQLVHGVPPPAEISQEPAHPSIPGSAPSYTNFTYYMPASIPHPMNQRGIVPF